MGARYQQPQVGALLDRGNPITRGAYAWLPSSPRVLIGGAKQLTASAETAYNSSPIGDEGVARKWSRSANAGVDFGTNQIITQNAGATVLVVAAPTSVATMKVPFSQRVGSGAFTQTDFVFNSVGLDSLGASAGTVVLTTYSGASGGVHAASQIDGKTHCWVAGNGPSNGFIFRDGVKQTLSTSTRTSTFTAGTQKLRIGNIADDATTTYPCDDPVYLVVVWDRLLSEAEAKAVSDNPWQVFRAPTQNIALMKAAAAGGGVTLSGDAVAIASASGSLAVAVPLAGAAVGVSTAAGQLSAAIPLSGAAAAVASASGSLSVGLSLSGAALAQTIASGALSSAFPLAGGAVAQASALGSLSIQFALSGAAVAQASASGNLNPGNSSSLAGNAQAQAQAAGALSIAIPLAGNAQAVASASGNLGSGTQLAGAAVSSAAASGNLAITVTLTGAALAQVIAAGSLAVAVPLSGVAVAQASAAGYLNGTEMKSLRHVFMPDINLTVDCPALSFLVAHPEINRTVTYEL
ncbi:MAG: hypothetical protein KGP14_09150 [Betaproteobacteria bacterium]|nr:hypothetical protein [Betaproteobacteria bacterium]